MPQQQLIAEEKRVEPGEHAPASGAMEERGSYNSNAKLPISGGAFALPHLRNAAWSIALRADTQPIVITADGMSQGEKFAFPRAPCHRSRADGPLARITNICLSRRLAGEGL
jgi:hypothetical protein